MLTVAVDGKGTLQKTILNRGLWGFYDDMEGFNYDLDRAKALMAEAGYPDGGISTTLTYSTSGAYANIATVIQDNLSKIGITVTLNPMEDATLKETCVNGDQELYLWRWNEDSKVDFVYRDLYYTGSTSNYHHYSDPHADELIDKVATEKDQDARMAAGIELQEYLVNACPQVPLYIANLVIAFNKDLQETHRHSGVAARFFSSRHRFSLSLFRRWIFLLKYIGKRLLMLLPVILVTSFLIFWAMSLTGGDPARQIAGDRATEAEVEAIREEMGLNDPFLVRYGNYMKGMLTGDMGKSYVTNKDVFRTFMEKLPNTLMLGGAAVLIAIIVSLPLGIYTAIHQNTWKDTAGMVFALFGTSMPNFWLGLMLIILFSLKLHWLPSGGKNGIASLILPALTVGFGLAALITRTTRSSMLDVIRQDYMTTARAKGCSEKRVIFRHGLKNALIPIITAIGLQMSLVITGSVLAETVFSWPGIGRLVYDSISKRDTPMVTGSIIMCSVLMCIINLIVDLIYAFFDPRIKAQYSKKR